MAWTSSTRFRSSCDQDRRGMTPGDLVFLQGDVERFVLPGVSRPQAFRQVCQKAHLAYVSVDKPWPAAPKREVHPAGSPAPPRGSRVLCTATPRILFSRDE